ncbi:sulfurtransferase complex subunit TusD [Balneatrix alpica]|uniref:Sulfurtransferase complex subunit TusD n=1 Tax=Balneatrix alpica TaxID=75684 RepID=A0ABV5Z6K0_9GAMM|nr:sulfurtransferase complex subunit TusD [Balneatrix alpica]
MTDNSLSYTLVVTAAPGDNQANHSALAFARALLAKGHQLKRVFFYGAAIHTGNSLQSLPQDEASLLQGWQQLQQQAGTELILCIAAAQRRGVLDSAESQRFGHQQHNIATGFELAGLGQLVDAALETDRLLTFGG